MKKQILIFTAVVCGMTCTTTAYAQFKIGGKKINVGKVVQAGTDAAKAITLSDADIAAMSREYMQWMDTHNPLTKPDTEYGKRLEKLTGHIKEVDGLKVNFGVYEVVDVNAFACGDGSVRICAGLMDIMTDDEVMAVVGHEQAQQQALEGKIAGFLKGKKATVGVAVLTNKDETILHNNEVHYPLLSVFKFHVALAVLDKMNREEIPLKHIVHVKASQLQPNTYSPLRQKHSGQDLDIPLGELLQYSISLSDNNACDILIEYAGGIGHIHQYIRKLGINDFNLSETEDSMHRNPPKAYSNWSTPSEMVRLLKMADEKNLFAPVYRNFLWKTMTETATGSNKLKGLLPSNTVVGHKTGSSDRNLKGVKMADNDAGIVIMPGGKKYYIAVFVTDSSETDEENAAIIAHISRMVYDEMK